MCVYTSSYVCQIAHAEVVGVSFLLLPWTSQGANSNSLASWLLSTEPPCWLGKWFFKWLHIQNSRTNISKYDEKVHTIKSSLFTVSFHRGNYRKRSKSWYLSLQFSVHLCFWAHVQWGMTTCTLTEKWDWHFLWGKWQQLG